MQLRHEDLIVTIKDNGEVDLHYNPCDRCNTIDSYCCDECYGERHIYTTIDMLQKIINKYKETKL